MYELPPPISFGVQNMDVAEEVLRAKGYDEFTVSYEDEDDIAQQLIGAFRHLETNVFDVIDDPTVGKVSIDTIRFREITAQPGRPFVLGADYWHVDLRKPHVHIQREQAMQYLVGKLSSGIVAGLIAPTPLDGPLSAALLNRIGRNLSNFADDNLPYGLEIAQPDPDEAHLLTEDRMHRSPVNTASKPVTRPHFDIGFFYEHKETEAA